MVSDGVKDAGKLLSLIFLHSLKTHERKFRNTTLRVGERFMQSVAHPFNKACTSLPTTPVPLKPQACWRGYLEMDRSFWEPPTEETQENFLCSKLRQAPKLGSIECGLKNTTAQGSTH
jgi:hypothetical protein